MNSEIPAFDTPIAEELKRRIRNVDTMLSMHALLRDRYSRWATALDLVMFGGSVLLAATVWLDPKILADLGVSDAQARIMLGVASSVLFFLSIVALRVDWKEKSGRHQRACAVLSELKNRQRTLETLRESSAVADYFRVYDFAMSGMEPVPERHFLWLKAKHLRKRAVSQALDLYPGASAFVLRAKMLVRETWVARLPKNEDTRDALTKR